MMSQPKELSPSCLGSWQEVDRHIEREVGKCGQVSTKDGYDKTRPDTHSHQQVELVLPLLSKD